jgi:hypothetical protein
MPYHCVLVRNSETKNMSDPLQRSNNDRYSLEDMEILTNSMFCDPAIEPRLTLMRATLLNRYQVDLNPHDVVDRELAAIREGRHQPPRRTASIYGCIYNWMKKEAFQSAYAETAGVFTRRMVSLVVDKSGGSPYELPIPASGPNPEQSMMRADVQRAHQQLIERFHGDLAVQQVIECMMDGISKPRHIAERTGMAVDQVNGATRRLRDVARKQWGADGRKR